MILFEGEEDLINWEATGIAFNSSRDMRRFTAGPLTTETIHRTVKENSAEAILLQSCHDNRWPVFIAECGAGLVTAITKVEGDAIAVTFEITKLANIIGVRKGTTRHRLTDAVKEAK